MPFVVSRWISDLYVRGTGFVCSLSFFCSLSSGLLPLRKLKSNLYGNLLYFIVVFRIWSENLSRLSFFILVFGALFLCISLETVPHSALTEMRRRIMRMKEEFFFKDLLHYIFSENPSARDIVLYTISSTNISKHIIINDGSVRESILECAVGMDLCCMS